MSKRSAHCSGVALALILALGLPAFSQGLPRLAGKVTRVLDGDTIEVELANGPIRVGLYGIDAPEKDQPVGKAATETLSHLVEGQTVLLEPFEQERYERMIATVYRDDLDVNAEMVRLGYAWAYRKYMKRANVNLCSLEYAARKAHLGIWSRPESDWLAPWEWRHLKMRVNPTNYSHETAGACASVIGKR